MGAFGNLVPLVILFLVVGGVAWVGYQIYLYSNELAERGVRKMEKKNVVFSKDGARVGIKEVKAEDYADRTQRAFVKTWNAAHESDGASKSPSGTRSSSSNTRPPTTRSASYRGK
ncbi:hypothetical protein BS50DRAFT_575828 [Corynespora cassiicola Philippines]|uniref:Uncharacterized protein n=1 Tax=Corynespora cassiicola Philippines TaxID=1448308 RepID=A0A2T2NG29_CORCC|nr:hypothetical protein BS50DRAFT_575828 [Corynespora cassiicola Philippines]